MHFEIIISEDFFDIFTISREMPLLPSLSPGPLASDQDQVTTTPRPSQQGLKGQAPRETEKEADRKLDNPYGLSDKKRRRSLKKLNTPVPHRLSSPHIFINISDPRTGSAFGGMEDTRHPHPFTFPSLKKPSTDEEYLPQKPGHMQGKRK